MQLKGSGSAANSTLVQNTDPTTEHYREIPVHSAIQRKTFLDVAKKMPEDDVRVKFTHNRFKVIYKKYPRTKPSICGIHDSVS